MLAISKTRPFLDVRGESVQIDPWKNDLDRVTHVLKDWDPSTNLAWHSQLLINGREFAAETGLGPGSTLRVSTVWRSSRTRLKSVSMSSTITLRDVHMEVPINVSVPGRLAGGKLFVTVEITLETANDASPLAATRPGSILWSTQSDFVLEGDAGRFPTSVVSFEDHPQLQSGAAWALHWPTRNYHEPLGASMMLLINESALDVVDAVRSDSSSVESEVLRNMIKFDVARSLIVNALNDDNFMSESSSFEAESVGSAIRSLLSTCWPAMSPSAIKTMMIESPARFETALQSSFLETR